MVVCKCVPSLLAGARLISGQRPWRTGENVYDDRGLKVLGAVLFYLIISVFVVVLLAILGFHVVKGNTGIVMILVFYSLFIGFILFLGPRGNWPLAAVLNYAAVLGTSLIGVN